MSSEPNSPTNLDPPPPAYEASQQELDQKVSHAIQRSLAEPSSIVDENGWPVYDASAFEATAASYERLGTGSSVIPDGHVQEVYRGAGDVKLSISTTAITPLRIRKRGAQREDASQDPAPGMQRTAVDRSTSPPPVLTPVTRTSWDGVGYEDVVRLTCHPDSRPSSPLSSPPTNAAALPERSLSPQSRQSRQPPPRRRSPRRSYAGQPLLTSRLDFDPSQAYKHSSDQLDMQAPTTYDATAFYNQSVAYHLSDGTPTPSRQANRSTPSNTSQYHLPRQSMSPSSSQVTPAFSNMSLTPSSNSTRSASPRPASALPPSTAYHRPAFPPGGLGPPTGDGGARASRSPSGPRWATSEAQMVRDLYRARN